MPDGESGIFFERGLDRKIDKLPVGQIRLMALVFLPSRRAPDIVGKRAIRQRLGQMQPAGLVGAVEISQCAGDAQHDERFRANGRMVS